MVALQARTFAERTHDNAVALMAGNIAAGNGSYVMMPNCFVHNLALKTAFSQLTANNWTAGARDLSLNFERVLREFPASFS